MGRLSDLLLGVSTNTENLDSPQTIGTTQERVTPQNPNRVFLYFRNTSSNTVQVAPEAEIATGEGFVVPANNGTVTFQIQEDGDIVGGEFHAIADGAGSDLVVRGQEVVSPIPEAETGV